MRILISIFLLLSIIHSYSQKLIRKIALNQTAYGIKLSDKNKLLFVAGKDSTCTVWTVGGQLLTTLQGHESSVSSISFDEEKSTILTGSYDNSAILWDLAGNVLARFQGHSNGVINIDQTGELVATASRDKTAAIWNRQGQLQHRLLHEQQVNVIKFVERNNWLVTASFDKTVKIWSYEGELLNTFKAHESGIRSVEISLQENLIVAGHRDGKISILDLQGNVINILDGHSGTYAMVNDLQFVNDDSHFLSSGSDGFIRIWELDGSLLHEFKAAEGEFAYVSGISHYNGTLVSSQGVDNSFKVWDLTDLQLADYSCTNPNYKILNSLIGTWQVTTRDRTSPGIYEDNTGEANIEKAIDGCGVFISFRGRYRNKPYARAAIVACLDSTQIQMVAMDSEHGGFSTYDGSIDKDEIILYWYRDKERRRLQSKYVMTINDTNNFEFSSYLSTDFGETWALTHGRLYRRKKR